MMERVRIVAMGPRDGLQNEKQSVFTAVRAGAGDLAHELAGCLRSWN
jgi:hypothetical protein